MSSKADLRNQSKAKLKQQLSESSFHDLDTLSQQTPQTTIVQHIQRAGLEASSLSPGELLQLQRVVGNQAVSQVIQRLTIKTENTAEEGQKNNADFTERPSEPFRETALTKTVFGGKEVPQTRHHIIPWNTLSAFIRKAYDRGHMFAVTDVLKPAVATMMANSPRMRKNEFGKVETVAPGEEGGTRTQGASTLEALNAEIDKPKGKEKNTESLDAITTAYCWMPGNLFLGPLNTLRLDDPDEGFEEGAADQVGSKFDQFKATFELIKSYLGDPKALKAREIRDFLKEVATQSKPYNFKEDSWVRVDDKKQGRYYLKNNADLPAVKNFLTPPVKSSKISTPKAKKTLTPQQLLEIEERKKAAQEKREQEKEDSDE